MAIHSPVNRPSESTAALLEPSQTVPARCLVVMYHYVHDSFAGAETIQRVGKGVRGVNTAEFENQLDRLCRDLEPVDWSVATSFLRGKAALPGRTCLLTFDDGLLEHAEVVAPILDRRGLKGLFFVPGSTLAGRTMLTAHSVHLLLEVLGEERLAIELQSILSTMPVHGELTSDDLSQAARIYHYETSGLARLKFLINMKLPLAVRASVVRRLFEAHVGSQQEWASRWYMNAEHVRALHASGHAIGGHSYAHEPYGRLDESALARDINRCAVALREVLGPSERPFAYPFGSVHPAAKKCLSAAGFRWAFGTTPTWMVEKSTVTDLPRVDTIHVDSHLSKDSI